MRTPDVRLKDVFDRAAEVEDPDERAALLDRECAGDPALRERVEALLRAHDAAGSFLARPPVPDRTTSHAGPVGKPAAVGAGPSAEAGLVVAGRYKLLARISHPILSESDAAPVRRLDPNSRRSERA